MTADCVYRLKAPIPANLECQFDFTRYACLSGQRRIERFGQNAKDNFAGNRTGVDSSSLGPEIATRSG
jgi:hypothetical protein